MSAQDPIISNDRKLKRTSHLLKKKITQRWTYSIYFCCMGLILLALYEHNEIKKRESLIPHRTHRSISSVIPQRIIFREVVKKVEKQEELKSSKPAEYSSAILESMDSHVDLLTNAKSLRSRPTLPIKDNKEERQDSIITSYPKSNSVVFVRKSSVQQTEVMISCFTNKEGLKMYEDKLLQSGIRLDIYDIVYGRKNKNGALVDHNAITYCNVDIYVGDSLYKSVELKNFKEFRIKWDTYNTGDISIKSVTMLDNNYIMRKL